MPTLATLNSSDRVFICGKTGSGKTYLSKHLTGSLKRLVVLDGKGTLDDWRLEPWGRQAERDLLNGKPVRIRALPGIDDDYLEYWDKVLGACYMAGDVTVYIDELYSVVPPNQNASNTLWACYTRGREFGLGIWAATQRPVWVPIIALSEAEHYFMFRLNMQVDRHRMAEFMTEEVESIIRDKHGFFYMQAEEDRPKYVRQLEV